MILPLTSNFCHVHYLSLATCEDPGVPENGIRRGNTFIDGDSVEYFCNRNYSLIGSSVIRCVEGIWSSVAPVCKGMKQVGNLLEKVRHPLVLWSRKQSVSHCSLQVKKFGKSFPLAGFNNADLLVGDEWGPMHGE